MNMQVDITTVLILTITLTLSTHIIKNMMKSININMDMGLAAISITKRSKSITIIMDHAVISTIKKKMNIIMSTRAIMNMENVKISIFP